MIQQQTENFHIPCLQQARSTIRQSRQQIMTSSLVNIKSRVDPPLQRTIELISVKCSSLWLTALPLQEQRFHLNKQEFRDALCLRYGWQLANIPSHCVCGTSFSVDHAMICRHGGLTFIHHNELRDLTAEWLQEVCHDVTVEPPLNGELITPSSANCSNTARADIHARGFWGRRQGALFDVRVFHPNAPSYRQTRVASLFRRHELEKKREYGDRIRWGLFYGTERNGTERNDGLNCGTECFLRLKLAAYHCCTSYQWHFQQVIKRYPKKDKTNLRIDCGFLLVVISNEVLIVGIADSVCSSSDISSRELNAWLVFTSMWVIFTYLTLDCTVWGPAFLIGINQYVYSYTIKETSMVTSWINSV